MSFARAFVTGVVVKNPEKRFTQNDMPISGFTVNIDQNNGVNLRVVSFGQLADNVTNSITQGDSVAVEGRLQINSFKLPNGKEKRVYEINANSVEKISSTQNLNTSNAPATSSNAQSSQNEEIVQFNQVAQDEIAQDLIDEDEIPF